MGKDPNSEDPVWEEEGDPQDKKTLAQGNAVILFLSLFLAFSASVYFLLEAGVARLTVEAGQGRAHAQTLLGNAYEWNLGVKRDHAEAAKWYRRAAEQGEPHGQMYLGKLYYEGNGVTRDYEEAYFWLSLADPTGKNPEFIAAALLIPITLPHLTPEQIAAVQKRVAEWKPVISPVVSPLISK